MQAEKLQPLPSLQRLNKGHPDGFADWLAGLVDGDGTFHFRQNNQGSWDFSFKIGQSNYNLKHLASLKKKQKCGSLTSAGAGRSQYPIRDPYVQHHFQIPLFDTTQFMTENKAFDYSKFKKALQIYNDWSHNKLSNEQRNEFLIQLKNQKKDGNRHQDHIVAAKWKQSVVDPQQVPSKGWILGFTEAEGSFYLVKKSPTRIVHGAGWVQAHEKELLECMCTRWNIKAKVKLHVKKKCWMLETTAKSAVERLIPFFENKLKGMKAVEVRKWARSFRKDRGNFVQLQKLQSQLRKAKNQNQFFSGYLDDGIVRSLQQ